MTHMKKEILEQKEVLKGIYAKNKATLDALAAELSSRKVTHAVFAARGTSDHASIYGQYMFAVHLGVISSLALPSVTTVYETDLKMENDIVIGVSQSGKAADALSVIEAGNKCGAVTLAVTNDPESPMAKAAAFHLDCSAGPEISVAATKTFTAEMFLLALLTAVWGKNEALLADLLDISGKVAEALDIADAKIPAITKNLLGMKSGFVLGRGINYPVALETALKIQETCYIKMKGYPTSDFYHGPIAQVDKETPVIILAPEGKTFANAAEMAEKINSIGASMLVITNNRNLADKFPSILLPETSEETAPFIMAPVIQSLAENLSVSLGLEPDSPRMLKKVTITK